MISANLLALVRCPDCRGTLSSSAPHLRCDDCGRTYRADGDYLDLRPSAGFGEITKYIDQSLHADHRHETVSPPLLGAAIRNDMLKEFLRPAPGDRVIDLGCGSGRTLVWNRDLGAYAAGVDVSPYFAREALQRADLVLGDLRQLPFADGSFTKAYMLDVLEHLSIDSLRTVMREVSRVLAPGGALFVYSHVRRNSRLAVGLRTVNRLARMLEQRGWLNLAQERLRKSDHVNPLADVPDLHRLISSTGFRLSRIRFYTPLVGGVVENLLVRLAEATLVRRIAAATPAQDAPRVARARAKERLGRRGASYRLLRMLTWTMKIDLVLFGRIESGPFFALLTKDGTTGADPSASSRV